MRTVLLIATLALSRALHAQSTVFPTAEEYAARALAAERAPLFESSEPIRMTLRTDIEWLVDERDDSLEVDGTLRVTSPTGDEVVLPVQVRARGVFRRAKRNCNFPPLRLDFPRDETSGSVFEGQNRLKLVTPCHDDRDDYQRYVYDEYLAYRVLNALTPYSFRVRFVEITYEDIEGDYETRTKIGFLIESDERMAERNRATYVEAEGMRPQYADGEHAVVVDLFSYMIGNLDWSAVLVHNAVLIRTEDVRYLAIPYDFDFSGVVNARYATEPQELADQVRSVRERLYRDFVGRSSNSRPSRRTSCRGDRPSKSSIGPSPGTVSPGKGRRPWSSTRTSGASSAIQTISRTRSWTSASRCPDRLALRLTELVPEDTPRNVIPRLLRWGSVERADRDEIPVRIAE